MTNIVHIVGRKNNGKTTLIVELIEEYMKRGMRVGSLKHSSHKHELDQPGKDSHRQRIAGANPAAVVSDDLAAVFITPQQDENLFESVRKYFSKCDLVLAEGAHLQPAVKIEVWREAIGTKMLCEDDRTIVAIISDDHPTGHSLPVWPRNQVSKIADNILKLSSGEVQQ